MGRRVWGAFGAGSFRSREQQTSPLLPCLSQFRSSPHPTPHTLRQCPMRNFQYARLDRDEIGLN
ncbi:MAG: hypothetical protein F6J93_25380 [Oscillatoria sp. SIO1A7]|nr:hypothetical protein [Oscillatoria sp. SIO1A7]